MDLEIKQSKLSKIWEFIKFDVFPPGNYRYYFMYVSSLITLGVSLVTINLCMDILIYGFGYDTTMYGGNLVAHTVGVASGMSDFSLSVVYNLFSAAGNVYLVYTVYVALAVIADIVWSLYYFYKWAVFRRRP